MPITQKLMPWAIVTVVMAVLAVYFEPYLIGPENIPDSKNILAKARAIPVPADGPEGMDWDPHGGGPYVGVVDGRVLKWSGEELGWVEFAHSSPHRGNCSSHKVVPTCGRPLGMSFEKKSGDLYYCDGYLGVMKVGPKGGLAEIVVDEVAGQRVMFANQMDIDEEEDIFYFNDSSDKYHFADVFYVTLCGEKTGRAIQYNMKTKESKVIMDHLHFPNGLVLNKDASFVLSCEAPTQLVHRYWIKGPKAGTRDIFAKVPGYADNIRRTEIGDFWVALHTKKTPFATLCLIHPWIGKFFIKTLPVKLLMNLFYGGKPHAIAVKLCGETGKILEILEDSEGTNMKYISETQERDGKLWFGSVFMPFVWVLDRK